MNKLSMMMVGAGLVLAVTGQAETVAPGSFAVSASEPAVSKDYAAMPAGVYVLDPAHTSVSWNVSHMGLSNFAGRFDKVSGTLVYDAKKPGRSALTVSVPVGLIDTNNPALEKQLKSEAFFDAVKYENIVFKSNGLTLTGPTTGKLAGEVSMLGHSVPVLFDLTLNGVGKNFEGRPTMGFTAVSTLHRSDFGMTAYAGVVGDAVTVTVQSEVGLEQRK